MSGDSRFATGDTCVARGDTTSSWGLAVGNGWIYIGGIVFFLMLKKKCASCAKKIERKFRFCPYCGASARGVGVRGVGVSDNEYGMLGREDSGERVQDELKLPFGMNKIVNSLVKQLEGQMNSLDGGDGIPRGFKIRIAGGPQMNQLVRRAPEKRAEEMPKISDEEMDRRAGLPREEVESRVRRLSDRIIYEMDTPGVKRKKDIVLTKLASGLEIKAYSRDKCYVKFIPLTVEVIEYSVEKDKVFVELKT